jgi:cytosine/adenosine deaminase-related metal-dependent hydrolase
VKVAIVNANIVVPHKDLILRNSSLVIDNGIITRINDGIRYRFDSSVNTLIDAEGGYLIPGLINNHSHAFTLGPFGPNGGKTISSGLLFRNLNRHLLQGTTTLINLDGFANIEEVEIINNLYPIKIKTGTIHTPLNIKAAEIVDGAGLTPLHKSLTVKNMLDRGAVVIGEVGAGNTLGGGAASYSVIPKVVEQRTGQIITTAQAEKLKISILGKYMDPSVAKKENVQRILEEIGLKASLAADEATDLIVKAVYSPVEVARDGIREAAELALKYDVPVTVHNAAASKDVVIEIAKRLGPKLIAGHSNHPSYDKDEMLEVARKVKKLGAIIDICSGDSFGVKQLCTPNWWLDATLKLIEEGLVDTLSTDFMAGHWDSMLMIIEKAVEKNILSFPKAVAMASYNVVKAIPKLSPDCGTIDVGKTADLAIIDANKLSRVKYVFIDGIPVVINGQINVPKPILSFGS